MAPVASYPEYISKPAKIPWPFALLDDCREFRFYEAPHQKYVVDPLVCRHKPPLLTDGALKHR